MNNTVSFSKGCFITLSAIFLLLLSSSGYQPSTLWAGNDQSTQGKLTINITPQAAIDAGARWRPEGYPVWRSSGATLSNLHPGEFPLEFKEIEGWVTPPGKTVTVTAGETTTVEVTYEEIITGLLRVNILPEMASEAGARWRRSGTEAWFRSRQAEHDVPVGTYYIEFTNIPGWNSPDLKEAEIEEDEISDIDAEYNWMMHKKGDLPEEISMTIDLLNWLESIYPEIFPSHNSIVYEEEGLFFRYYPDTDLFAGSFDGSLWTYQPSIDGEIVNQGSLKNWHDENKDEIEQFRKEQEIKHSLDSVKTLDWLESVYPAILPVENRKTLRKEMLYLRYYPRTETYLGSFEGRLWVYWAAENDLQDLGLLKEWRELVRTKW